MIIVLCVLIICITAYNIINRMLDNDERMSYKEVCPCCNYPNCGHDHKEVE